MAEVVTPAMTGEKRGNGENQGDILELGDAWRKARQGGTVGKVNA